MQQLFQRQFQQQAQWLSSSPGRINIIGEHTDYNDGFVLPGAIDKKISFLLAPSGHPHHCRVYSADLQESVSFSLKELKALESGSWKNYIIGVAAELQQAGGQLQGFNGVFWGDIPLGAGLSSSAALECALAGGLNALFDLNMPRQQWVEVAQRAEHNYAGVACGIMDQFASVMGKKDQVFRLDCRSLDYAYYPMDLGDYELILFDTRVKHSLSDSAYNERREQCEQGVSLLQSWQPGASSLRDISPSLLSQHQAELPEVIYRRCRHVVSENERVLQAGQALLKHDLPLLGQLLYQSHDSLSGDYEVSCPELDFLVDFTRQRPEVLGSRMMGGGFGGCTLNLVASDQRDGLVHTISQAYLAETGIALKVYPVSLEEGTQAKPV
jgi:galactokinase